MSGRHSPEDSILARYYIETRERLSDVARDLVVLETTAKWTGQTAPTDLYLSSVGEVAAVEEIEPGRGFIDLLYPLSNFDLEDSAFSCLWLSMIGGPTFALASYERSRLVDFSIPQSMMDRFPGPAYGVGGTRRLVGLESGELMVGTIVKPTAGMTPKEIADLAYHAAMGGICFIKDDEKMMNPPYCPSEIGCAWFRRLSGAPRAKPVRRCCTWRTSAPAPTRCSTAPSRLWKMGRPV